jgi:hypothetical protein
VWQVASGHIRTAREVLLGIIMRLLDLVPIYITPRARNPHAKTNLRRAKTNLRRAKHNLRRAKNSLRCAKK